MIETYFQEVRKGLDQIIKNEKKTIEYAAQKVYESLKNMGIVHIFGCGHSHMMAEELFYRAGGLAQINPILIEPLMLHEGAVRSSTLEKSPTYGKDLLKEYQIDREDIFIVVSTSGRNPVPIDVALQAKEKGCTVIGLTSLHYVSLPSKHESGCHLSQVVDIAIHNHVVMGDSVLTHPNVHQPFSPVSSIYNMTILHALISNVIEKMADKGDSLNIFLSGNIDHAEEHNVQLVNVYKERIPLLNNPVFLSDE